MNGTKSVKWYQHKLLHSLGLTTFSVFLGKAIEKYGNVNMDMIKSLFQTLVVELWPMWFGIGIGLIYLAIREIIAIHKFLTSGIKFNEVINKQGEEKREFISTYTNTCKGNSRRIDEILARMDKIEKQIKTSR